MRTLLILSFALIASLSFSQEALNRTDAAGRKQGSWRKTDSTGMKVYEGQFRDGIPYGEFRYYYPTGQLRAVSQISNNGKRSWTVTRFINGKKMAEGLFINEKRDSLWKFFSASDDALLAEEWYKGGVKDGVSKTYYGGKGTAEMMTWVKGERHGPWEQYFTDGSVKLRGTYKHDEKDGKLTAFFLNGKPQIIMTYANGQPEGTWYFYNEKGEIIKREIYKAGTLVRTEEPK